MRQRGGRSDAGVSFTDGILRVKSRMQDGGGNSSALRRAIWL